jgi:hypothetical protein
MLIEAGFTVPQLREGGYSASSLKHLKGVGLIALKRGGSLEFCVFISACSS